MAYFRGSELQNYFTKILEDDLKALIKPQYVDQIPKAVKGVVKEMLDRKAEQDNLDQILNLLGDLQFCIMCFILTNLVDTLTSNSDDLL